MASGDERILCRMLATQFRMGIEASFEDGAFKGVRTPFFSFPRGCCGLASDLLQRFLAENGVQSWTVYGDCWDEACSCGQSHTWLELDDSTVVDITGDQFKGRDDCLHNSRSVYCDSKNEFYGQFKVDQVHSYMAPQPLREKEELLCQIIIEHLPGDADI